MEYLTFKKRAAQGDVFFTRIDEMPKGYVEVPCEKDSNDLIVTHSETGHHHVMDGRNVKMYRNPNNEYDSVLVVDKPTPIIHKRSFDTHAPIMFDSGIFHVRRQREWTPEGYRRVED